MALGLPPLYVALPILVITYALVMIDRFDRSILALLGGGAMVLSGVLTQQQAVAGIDFNTIGLLTGMMILVAISRRSGVFEYLAIRAVQAARASPAGLLVSLALVTAILSALLGWFAAGRVLRPLRQMTEKARTISAGNLSRRLALTGPRNWASRS